ncbi:MAG: HAD family hydrolase [Nitrospirae bacterium]|nr:HAD family hydrolase [Nitrospirota bacterium]MBI3352092.1 HAD family hydrolase [Nitrospirota bacterium]
MNLIGLDLDGTLEDSRSDMIASVRRVRSGFGIPPRGDEEVAPWVNQGMETLYRNCFDDFLKTGDEWVRLKAVQTAYETDYLDHVACETKLYPEIPHMLEGLHELGSLVVVTNKPERISKRLLEALKVDRWFRGVVGGDSCGAIKPDPLMLRTAAKICGFNSSADLSFMIGDTSGDIKMGRAYGAITFWCKWGYSSAPGEKPDFIAGSPLELPRQIRAILSKIPG